MNKNAKTVAIAGIVGLAVLLGLWVARDLLLGTPGEIKCDDGARRTIDIRDFTTRYWAYSVEFEASLQNAGKLQGKLAPQRLQELSAAQQQANEFRKFVVAGFNSCALGKAQYAEFGVRFQALDSVARQIDGVLGRATLGEAERKLLDDLATQYTKLAQQLATGKG